MAKGRKARSQGEDEETEVADSPTGSGTRVQVRKVRRDGWTKAKRERFLIALASTANVTKAAEAAEKSKTSVYELRHRDPVFAAQWQYALEFGVELLEFHMLEQSLEGIPTPVIFQGQITDNYRTYPHDVSKFLVSRHGKTGDAAAGGQAAGSLHRRLQAQQERQEQVRQKLLAEIREIADLHAEELASESDSGAGGEGA